jgi:hypothetical protein
MLEKLEKYMHNVVPKAQLMKVALQVGWAHHFTLKFDSERKIRTG